MKRKEIFRRTVESDEEYDPSMAEIRADAELQRDFDEAIDDIERELQGKESWNERTPMHPGYVEDTLTYMFVDLKQIKERSIREKISKRIADLEKKVFLQFIPFIKLHVEHFGYSNSPLEGDRKYVRPAKADPIEQYFYEARTSHLLTIANPEDKLTYTLEIDRLEQRFSRFRREHTLYTFEKMEREIWQALDNEYWKMVARKEVPVERMFDDQNSRHRAQEPLFRIKKSVEVLQLVAENMQDKFIREESMARATRLLQDVEQYQAYDAKKTAFSKPESRDHAGWAFELLGVSEHVTKEELRSVYRKAARAHHPDLNPGKDRTQIQNINAAYDFIMEVKGFGQQKDS